MINRRVFLGRVAAAAALGSTFGPRIFAALPKMKITRVRAYQPPNPNPLFNQSDVVVTVETDAGITGIGEGGAKDTLAPEAGRLIGRDPQHIEQLWQDMNRAFFYPAGMIRRPPARLSHARIQAPVLNTSTITRFTGERPHE